MRKWHTIAVFLAVAALMLTSTGCRDDEDTIRVGGKNFAEQDILAEIIAQLIEDQTDLEVDTKPHLGGTSVCHRALKGGSLDIYVEYTGTGLRETLPSEGVDLSLEDPSDADAVYQAVKKAYADEMDLVWLKPLGFNNSYVLTMRGSDANQAGLDTISDLARYDGIGNLQPGFTAEFVERKDGYPAVAETYGFRFPQKPKSMEPGLMYSALANGGVDVISGFATDGLIEALDLKVLKDDKNAFVPYDAAPVIRKETLEAHPELREVINKLAGRLTREKMREMNLKVTREDHPMKEADVAREFLVQEGLIEE